MIFLSLLQVYIKNSFYISGICSNLDIFLCLCTDVNISILLEVPFEIDFTANYANVNHPNILVLLVMLFYIFRKGNSVFSWFFTYVV